MRHAVILAGGAGTRLWPLSRPDRPKQLLPILPDGQSLLSVAVQRMNQLDLPSECQWICTAEEQADSICESIGWQRTQCIVEPCGRDTLNAIGLTANLLQRRDPDAVLAILTADHVIHPIDRFAQLISRGFEVIEQSPESLVTFGILPTRPATEYGYIKRSEPFDGCDDVFVVDAYTEKPERKAAEAYANDDSYGWSSGMFVFRASTMFDRIARYEPENARALAAIGEKIQSRSGDESIRDAYSSLRRISIDYAVMEPASRDEDLSVLTIPMDIDWIDVGSWSSLARLYESDTDGNREAGARARLLDCRDCIVVSNDQDHRVAMIGCADLVVVHTADATLICPKDREQEIRDLVGQLPSDDT